MSDYIAKQSDSCGVCSVHELCMNQNLDASTDKF